MIRKAATPMASAVQARAAVDLNDLPWAHRLGYWIDQVCAASAEADCELASDPNQLHGRLSHLRVGDIAINHLRVSAQTFRRTRAHLSHAREDVFALVRVCSGSAQVEQGGRRITLGAGDLAINSGLQTGDMHLSENADVMLTVIPAALMQSITGTAHPRGTLLISGRGPIAPLLSGFLNSLTTQADQLSPESAAHLRNGLLSTLAAACAANAAEQPGDIGHLADYHRARVLALMRERLATPGLDVSALAAGVGLSASQIHRLFPASSGSPMRRLWALRLERARELLDTTRLPHLAEVAWLCGFQSQAHFTHAFKKAHGLTPRAYLAARTACSAHGGSDTQRG